MDATKEMTRKCVEMAGRYAVTLECADDLTDSELVLMLEFFEAERFAAQNRDRGDENERKARFRTWMTL